MTEPMDVPIRDESIRLGQFLKLANLVEPRAEAKPLLAGGAVAVNGEVETRRGRQLVLGDVVGVGGSRPGRARATTSTQVPTLEVACLGRATPAGDAAQLTSTGRPRRSASRPA